MTADVPIERGVPTATWVRFLEAPIMQEPTAQVAVGALVVGVAFDIAMRAEIVGIAGALTILLASVVLLTTREIRNPHAIALIGAAPVFGSFLFFRTSDWLIPFDIMIAAGLLGFGASLARGGSGLDLTIPDLAGRVTRGALQAIWTPAFLSRGITGGRSTRLGAIARGVIIVTPIVIVLGALLMSADAVFASFLVIDLSGFIQHAFAIAFGTIAFGALLRLASVAPADVPRFAGRKLGAVETSIVLVALNILLGAFAVARIIALSDGGQRVLREAGLTYAEYARSGFFQLLVAAVIVIATLLALRATADLSTSRGHRVFAAMSIGVVVLTLAVCVSAFHRLVLYEGAFGLTMLRLYVMTAIVWVGIVLILLGIAVALRRVDRQWLAPAAALAGLILVFALNVMNPEAFVARHNVAQPPSSEGLDADYLSELSDDALPAIADSAKGESPASVALRTGICSTRPAPMGWASYNVARDRADAVRAELCR